METSYGPRVGEPLPQRIDYPAMSLRRYEGSIGSAGGMRLFTSDTILPDTSGGTSLPASAAPGSTRSPATSPGSPQAPAQARLAGDYYNLDCLFDGHFGHLTTEVVSRLWGWDQAKRENPDLKALFHVRPQAQQQPGPGT